MIEQAVRAVCDALNWDGGLRVTICVPEGAALAKKTFNPQLGIEGGISILGTSGIVEPMSMQALIDTVALSLRQARAQGPPRAATPGQLRWWIFCVSRGWTRRRTRGEMLEFHRRRTGRGRCARLCRRAAVGHIGNWQSWREAS